MTIRARGCAGGAPTWTIFDSDPLLPQERPTHELRRVHLLQPRRRRAARPGRAAWPAPAGQAVAPATRVVGLPGPDRAGGDPGAVDVDPGRAGRLGALRAAGVARGGPVGLGQPGDRALGGDQ